MSNGLSGVLNASEYETNSSSSNVSEDIGSNTDSIVDVHRIERFNELLERVEKLTNFMNNSASKSPPKKRSKGRPKKNQNVNSGYVKNGEKDIAGMAKGEKLNLAANSNGHIQFKTTPSYIKNGEMRDYQIRGLNWMISLHENGINGILADEMGLGKTLQIISLLGYMKHYKKKSGPYLVIVPKSTLLNWMNEFKKWCPSLEVVCLIGEKKDRKHFIRKILLPTGWDVCVVTYEICRIEVDALKKFNWLYIVVDEAHRLKNETSKLSEYVRKLTSKNRLLLTGTPLQNNLHELWALLNYILPDIFNSARDFDSWFNTNSCLGNNVLIERLHAVLKPFLLRRLKSEVEKDLKPKKEVKIFVGLSKLQREWYKKILLKDIGVLTGEGKMVKMRLLNMLMQLRKCTNHPYLFEGAEPGPPFTTGDHLVYNSGKMVVLDKLLSKLQQQGSRVLLFSQFTTMLDIIEDYCVWRGYDYCRVDGNIRHDKRQEEIDEFNAHGSSKFIFLLSTRAGGLGINLATADTIIIYDSDWNPQMDLQAIDRAHRIGQQKQVKVFRLITEHTVEEKIVERAEVKLRLDRLVIQQGCSTEKELKSDEILGIIRFAANQMMSLENADLADEDIDTILEKGEIKTAKQKNELDSLGKSEIRSFTLDNRGDPLEIYQFEGMDYKEKQKQSDEISALRNRPKRERRERCDLSEYFKQAEDIDLDAETWFKSRANQIDEDYNETRMREKITNTSGKSAQSEQLDPQDFHFFPPRLFKLLNKEQLYNSKRSRKNAPRSKTLRTRNDSLSQEETDKAQPLTESEIEEKESLLKQGFMNWTKQDFRLFIKANEKYGRKDINNIAMEIGSKSVQEVMEYSKVFWQRFSELSDANKILAQIERGEATTSRNRFIKELLEKKISQYKHPFRELKIHYERNRQKVFTEDDDRLLICMLHQIGVEKEHVYEKLKAAILDNSSSSSFLKSLEEIDLKRRCTTLISLIEKEQERMNKENKVVKSNEAEQSKANKAKSKRKLQEAQLQQNKKLKK